MIETGMTQPDVDDYVTRKWTETKFKFLKTTIFLKKQILIIVSKHQNRHT